MPTGMAKTRGKQKQIVLSLDIYVPVHTHLHIRVYIYIIHIRPLKIRFMLCLWARAYFQNSLTKSRPTKIKEAIGRDTLGAWTRAGWRATGQLPTVHWCTRFPGGGQPTRTGISVFCSRMSPQCLILNKYA